MLQILCLGAGESGKSTVIKQLTFIHKQQTTPEERLSYVKVLQQNTLQCMITLIREAEAFGYSFSDDERVSADAILLHDQRANLPYDFILDIDRLWQSEAIQLTYARRNEYWHLEATEYYFANAERYVSDGFVPTEEDMVMARKRTTGVVVTELDYGGIHWSCVDVGGQRSERRKWLNCFDSVKAIIYVVNLAGYCKVLFEDKAVNRMHESLNLFEATMSNPLFAHTPVFIFLNKKDLFEHLIRHTPIDCCFPEYQGPTDLHACIEYISEEYQRRMPPNSPKPTFLLLAARMKKDVQYCFEEVKDILLDHHKKTIVKAKKALERVEKRNKERGVPQATEDGNEDPKAGDGGQYKVRGLQGWETTRKPAKVALIKRSLPVTKSQSHVEVAPAPVPEEGERERKAEARQDGSAPAEERVGEERPAPPVITPADHTEGGELQAPLLPPSTAESSAMEGVGGVEMSTMAVASAAVHEAPRPSQSGGSELVSGTGGMVTPRTDVRIEGSEGGGVVEEEGEGRGEREPESRAAVSHAKSVEETKELDDRDGLIPQTTHSDAVLTTS